jgi:hypothetical protein
LKLLGAAMSSKVPKNDLSFGDTSSSESATLVPYSPKIAGRKKPDKEEGGELVIPAKATVGENPIIDVKASVQRRAALNKRKLITAPPGTAKRRMAELNKKNKENTKEQ